MRSASSYRGVRRNKWRADKTAGSWAAADLYYHEFSPKHHRRSFVSKNPSKYMPHDRGKQYANAVKRPPKVGWIRGLFAGLPYHQMMHKMRGFG